VLIIQFKFKGLGFKPDKPAKIATFDLETFGLKAGKTYALGFYDGQKYYTWEGIETTIQEFIKHYITKKYRSHVCYAHNGGKFDFLYLLEILRKEIPTATIEPMLQGSRIVQIKIRDKNNHTWTFKDSVPIFQTTLKKLLQDFNCDTQKGEFDHEKINEQNWKQHMPEIRPYLKADCTGLHEALTKFETTAIKETGVSLKRITTTAQLAMRTYRKKFFEKTNLKEMTNYQAIEKFIRQAYYGGRTEIFKIKGENLNYYDVNSEYPDVMKEKDMPVGTPIKSYNMEINDFGIAYATITCPTYINKPVLPKRHKIGVASKLYFPTGTWNGWYCTPELQKALEIGYTIKIHYGFKFQKAKIFSEYIDYFYNKKQTTTRGSPTNQFSKLCLNSLYGKFGQRRERNRIIIAPKSIKGLEPIDEYGENNVWKEKVHSDSSTILPAIACFVTCYARLKLYSYLENDESVCYCDTDSIITNKVHPTGNKLGELKLEKQIIKAIFLRPKMYFLEASDGKLDIKAKGFTKDFREKLTYTDFDNALSNNMSAFNYEGERISSMSASLRINKKFLSSNKIKRSLKTPYDKRIILANGETIPINIDELNAKEAWLQGILEFDQAEDKYI